MMLAEKQAENILIRPCFALVCRKGIFSEIINTALVFLMQHRTWIELDAEALRHNVATVHALCHPATLGVVVKANAYGHGMQEIARLLETYPEVQWLFVAGPSEGVTLRKLGIKKPILALSYLDGSLVQALEHDIAVTIYTHEDALAVQAAAERVQKQARVHIKIDSNMSRLGIMPEQCAQFFSFLQTLSYIQVEGIFTHLSDTNNSDLTFTYEQLALFDTVIAQHAKLAMLTHALASGALMLEKKYDLVRAGTNIYGFWKSEIQKKRFEALMPGITFKQVLTWKTKILQIKDLPAGACVGYNRAFQATQPCRVATIAVGYYDGYPRQLSNKGFVLVRGKLAPVIGIVSMNMTTIDITHIPDALLYDEVILLGDIPGVRATEVADAMGTIANDLVTRINEHIPRIVVEKR